MKREKKIMSFVASQVTGCCTTPFTHTASSVTITSEPDEISYCLPSTQSRAPSSRMYALTPRPWIIKLN